MPEPATRSLTVLETITSSGFAAAATRAPICTAMPRCCRRSARIHRYAVQCGPAILTGAIFLAPNRRIVSRAPVVAAVRHRDRLHMGLTQRGPLKAGGMAGEQREPVIDRSGDRLKENMRLSLVARNPGATSACTGPP